MVSYKVRLFLLLLLLAGSPLYADRRTYEAEQPLGVLIAKLVEELSESNAPFTVMRVYNPDRDGKQGMMLVHGSARTMCELVFLEHPGGRRSGIRVLAQDPAVDKLIHDLLTGPLGMREAGVNDAPLPPNNWPVQP
ncbi:MAG: hypothetical protein K1X75_16420 [Leptospirales bacterium]|nr:hypothetical protein [Leptospirales bacterium]